MFCIHLYCALWLDCSRPAVLLFLKRQWTEFSHHEAWNGTEQHNESKSAGLLPSTSGIRNYQLGESGRRKLTCTLFRFHGFFLRQTAKLIRNNTVITHGQSFLISKKSLHLCSNISRLMTLIELVFLCRNQVECVRKFFGGKVKAKKLTLQTARLI